MTLAREMPGESCEVRLGDCIQGMRELADQSVDVVITDPPYSAHVDANFATCGKRTGTTRKGKPVQVHVTRESIGIGHVTRESIGICGGEFARIAKRWILVFCAFEDLSTWSAAIEAGGGRYVRACAWEKPDATPQLSGDRPATWGECFVVGYASSGRMRWNAGGRRGLYRNGVCRGSERSEHPTQKPLDLMLQLVADFSDPSDLVLDPFAGSGTTGVACRQLGRRFLGWELDAKYHEIACRRLRGEAAKIHETQLDFLSTKVSP